MILILQKKSKENEVAYSSPFSDMISCIQNAEVTSSTSSRDRVVWTHPALHMKINFSGWKLELKYIKNKEHNETV
jgi:hypothetical protein